MLYYNQSQQSKYDNSYYDYGLLISNLVQY